MATQLEIQQALNRAVRDRNELLKEQSKLIKSQLADVVGLKQAWADADPKTEDILRSIKDMQEALGSVTDELGEMGDTGVSTTQKIAERMLRARTPTTALSVAVETLSKKFPLAWAAAAGFIDGIVQGFAFVKNTLKSTVGLVQSIVKGFTDVGISILEVPFRSLEGLIAISNKLVPLMEAVARATEEVRKQFGAINDGAGREIIATANRLGEGFENLGLGGYRVFGSLDERIQATNKLATAMAATFDLFREEVGRAGGAVMLLQRGLGIADEEMAGIAKRARAFGSSLTTQLKAVTRFAVDFGKRFDISQKLISRDIGQMMKDVKNFGNLAPRELATISVFARKLGIDVKELLGVIEKFDTFESAAESAAMLSQAFGAQTDAIKLMRAESPAERIEELRRAFLATGKSADLLTRQELKLLSQTTGLAEETARAVFSQKNMGVSLADLEKQGKSSEKQQLTTAQAVKELASSIERVVKPFRQFTSFIMAFADGFARGLFQAKDFRSLLIDLRGALRKTYEAGMAVGKMFLELFPGVRGLIDRLREMFKTGSAGRAFTDFITRVKSAFGEFFSTIEDGPRAMQVLFEKMRQSFELFLGSFDVEGASAQGTKFVSAMGNIVAGIVRVVADGAVTIIDTITSLLTGEELPDIPGKGLVKSFMDPIIKEFQRGEPLQRIGGALMDMFEAFWDRYGDRITPVLQKLGIAIFLAMFGPAVIKSVLAVIVTQLTSALVSGLASMVSSGALFTAAEAVGGAIVTAISSPFVAIPALIAAALGGAVGVSLGMEKFQANLEKEFGKTESMVGAAVAGIIDVLTLGLVPDSLLESVGSFAARGMEMLFDAIESLPFGKAITEHLESMMQSGLEFLGALGDLARALFEGDADKIAQTATRLGATFMDYLVKVFTDGIPLIGKLFQSLTVTMGGLFLKGLAWLAGQAAPWVMGLFSNLMAALASVVAGAYYKLADLVKDVPIVGGVISAVLHNIGDFWKFISGLFVSAAKTFSETVAMWDGLKREVNDMFSRWGESISKFFDRVWETIKMVLDMTRFTKLAADAGKAIIDGFYGALMPIGDTVKDAATRALDAFKNVWGVRSPSREAMSIGRSITQGLNDSMNEMPDSLRKVAARGLDVISDIFRGPNVAKQTKDFMSPAVTVIKSMIDEANTIGEQLKNLDAINLDAKLQALADKLGIEGEQFKVKQGQVNIVINLDVTMEAEKLAKVLSEHGIVSTERTIR